MTTPAWVENKQLRKRLLQREEEIAFLRERNYRIQRLSDSYRLKVSQFIASIHARGGRSAGMTEAELTALLQRLRSCGVSPRRRADSPATPSPRRPLSREDDDGLIHSSSSASLLTQAEPAPAPAPAPASGPGPAPASGPGPASGPAPSSASGPASGSGPAPASAPASAAARTRQAVVARLAAENRNLAALVDALKVKLATAARLHAALERKLRACREETRSGASVGGATADALFGSTAAQQRQRDGQSVDEQLRKEQENARELAREAAHYKTLVERQRAEVAAAQRREKAAKMECEQRNEQCNNATEKLEKLKASLRLSRLREKRACDALSQVQKQQEEKPASQEPTESRSENRNDTSMTMEGTSEKAKGEAMQTFLEMWSAIFIHQYESLQGQLFEAYTAHVTLAALSVTPDVTFLEIMRREAREAQRQTQVKAIVATPEKLQENEGDSMILSGVSLTSAK